jgi:hypothetical protein
MALSRRSGLSAVTVACGGCSVIGLSKVNTGLLMSGAALLLWRWSAVG